MRRLVLESTAPFQGLPELVAYDEGLFANEGLAVEWAERDKSDRKTAVDVTSPKAANPFVSHGSLLELVAAAPRWAAAGVGMGDDGPGFFRRGGIARPAGAFDP